MNAKEMKLLTGAKTARLAHGVLCDRIRSRRWTYQGNPAYFAGADSHLVHFTQTLAVSPGVCSHIRLGLTMEDSIDCITGNLDGQKCVSLF